MKRSPRVSLVLLSVSSLALALALASGCLALDADADAELIPEAGAVFDGAADGLGFGPPPAYYAQVDASSASALRDTLHRAIARHHHFSFKGKGTWQVLEQADQDPDDATHILDVYKDASYAKTDGSNRPYNREHVWPKSYGFPDVTGTNLPVTDCHNLWLSDITYNEARGNKPFRACDTGCVKMPTADGRSANFVSVKNFPGAWQTWPARRGDLARALFYMDLRYEGGENVETHAWEPQLALTDDVALITESQTGHNEKTAYMGLLATLLEWHQQDPVDQREQRRNAVVFEHQKNRNPFVDHPEWVACIYGNSCP